MSHEVILNCDGTKQATCTATYRRTGLTVAATMREARAEGWKCHVNSLTMLCEACHTSSKAEADRIRKGCRGCNFRAVRQEFNNELGHDLNGHRVANLLASRGVNTWAALLALRPFELRNIQRLGANGLALITRVCEDRRKEHTT